MGGCVVSGEQWRRNARSGSIERKTQVNVTITIILLLDWAPFYHFYSGLRTRKIYSTKKVKEIVFEGL